MSDAAFTARAKEIANWTAERAPSSEEKFEADFEAKFEMTFPYWQGVKARMEKP